MSTDAKLDLASAVICVLAAAGLLAWSLHESGWLAGFAACLAMNAAGSALSFGIEAVLEHRGFGQP